MKNTTLRSSLALLCGAILSACGSSDGSLQIAGSITGLTKDGLVLLNTSNGDKFEVTTDRTRFVFTKQVSVDDNFNITVQKPGPSGATCVVNGGSGKANVYNAYNVQVVCTNDPRNLGGAVVNLKGAGLVMANGTDTVSVPAGAASFVFPRTIGDGSAYGISVLKQPAGQSCTVTGNAVGTIGNQDLVYSAPGVVPATTPAVTVSCADVPAT